MDNEIKNGAVLFTFDDCDIEGWTKSIELFRRYNGHATFFFCGAIGEEQIGCMKKLSAAGHSLGLHTLNHTDAPEFISQYGGEAYWQQEIAPQLAAAEAAGLNIRNFAFPNNRKDDTSIVLLSRQFKRFRAGCGARLTEPDTPAYEKAFFPVSELADKQLFGGFGVGEYYKTKPENLLNALEKAALENKVLVIFSHAITPQANGVNMPLELLTTALEKADSLGMKIIGFDDLPQPKNKLKVVQCWDDGTYNDIRVAQILRKYNAKATFNLCPAWMSESIPASREENPDGTRKRKSGRIALADIADVYSGFQVASHCWNHENAEKTSPELWIKSAIAARTCLERITGRVCAGLAYPHGVTTPECMELLKKHGFAYARITRNIDNVMLNTDVMSLMPNCHFQADDFWQRYETAKQNGSNFFYFWGHSYELEDDELKWQQFEEKIKKISEDSEAEWADVIDLANCI